MAEPTREELIEYARTAAIRNGIDPEIFVRQINQESGFNVSAKSPAGAKGIAQIVPVWHPGVNVDDPFESLDYAAALMASHFAKYGDYPRALAAYNAGGGTVDKYGGVPPFEETQRYVKSILGVPHTPIPSPTESTDTSSSSNRRYKNIFQRILPQMESSPLQTYFPSIRSVLPREPLSLETLAPPFPSIRDVLSKSTPPFPSIRSFLST